MGTTNFELKAHLRRTERDKSMNVYGAKESSKNSLKLHVIF